MEERKPIAPASIPNYIADGLPKQSDENLHDVIDYCEQLLAHRDEQELEIPDDAEIVEDDDSGNSGSIVLEKVKCGKDACHCADGDDLHGPYKYRYWKENGKTNKEYVGKPD